MYLCPLCDETYRYKHELEHYRYLKEKRFPDHTEGRKLCAFCEKLQLPNERDKHIVHERGVLRKRQRQIERLVCSSNDRPELPDWIQQEVVFRLCKINLNETFHRMLDRLPAVVKELRDAVSEHPDHVCVSLERALYKQKGRVTTKKHWDAAVDLLDNEQNQSLE